MSIKKKIAVIGAGPAGAAAAYYLKKDGYEVEVFEKEAFVGGRTHGFDNGTISFDTGASFFTNFYPLLISLVKELDLEDDVLELKRRVGLKDKDQFAEFAFGNLKTFWNLPFLTLNDKMTMLWKTFLLTLKRRQLDLVDPGKLSKFDDASIADWARGYMTDNIYEYCIKPGVEPFWYFSCEDVSRAMTTVLQGRAADAKFYTFKNGMASISKKLLKDITLHNNCLVQKIELSDKNYQVSSIKDQLLKTSIFDGIVMASPATAAKKILAKELIPEYIAEFINTQKYVANLHATYLVNREEVKNLLAYYYPCGKWKTPIAAIVLHKIKSPNSIKAPADKELISVYLLDNPTKELLNEPKEIVLKKVWEMARNFEPLLPIKCEHIELFIREEAIPLHEVGRYRSADKINKNQKGNLVFAGDYLSCATVEGALRSGRWAAYKLMNKNSITF